MTGGVREGRNNVLCFYLALFFLFYPPPSPLLTDTDSFAIEVEAPSYHSCGKYLELADLYLSVKEISDFSPFLDVPTNRMWAEFRARMTEMEYAEFVQQIRSRRGGVGLWKIEHGLGAVWQCVKLFYVVRIKCYAALVHLEDETGQATTFLKRTMKGGILKARANAMELADYFRLGQYDNGPILEQDMRKLAVHNWKIYFAHVARMTPSIFCRKKVLVNQQSGLLAPHGFLSDDKVPERRENEGS